MKSYIIPSLLAVAAHASAHTVNKRDIVWITQYTEVVETTYETATIWVPYPTDSPGLIGAATAAAAPIEPAPIVPEPASNDGSSIGGGNDETPGAPASSAAAEPVKPLGASPAPAQSLPAQPAQHSNNNNELSAQSISPAPQPKPEPAPAPAPAPAPPSASAPVSSPASSTAPASPAPATSSGGSGQSYSGEVTYYDPGLGSCGITSSSSEPIVAISHVLMDAHNTGNPNANPLCGKMVNITYNGKTTQAKVVDRCVGCAEGDLDMSSSLFQTVAGDLGQGRVSGVTWSFAN